MHYHSQNIITKTMDVQVVLGRISSSRVARKIVILLQTNTAYKRDSNTS